MQVTYEHLKTLYDLLSMQQSELLTLSTLLVQKDHEIQRLQREIKLCIPVESNGIQESQKGV